MKTRLLLIASALLVSQLAWAADQPSDNKPQEVVIEATRANLNKISAQVKAAEFKFYKRYNDINKKREYAINCNKEATIGSRFTSDICMPVYASKAQEAEAQAFLYTIGAGMGGEWNAQMQSQRQQLQAPPGQGAGTGGGGIMPSRLAIEAGRSDFQKNVIEVVSNSPELTKLAVEHAKLWKQWEDLYFRVNGREVRRAEDTPDSGKK